MTRYALAVDLGAGSGRHIIGWKDDAGHIHMEEIYRFPNGVIEKDGKSLWDTDALFEHIILGMKACLEAGKIPSTVAIDTWGVDYVLLDERLRRVGDAVSYRDARTEGMPEKLEQALPYEKHYAKTGTGRQAYNTVYQLMADFSAHPERRETAKHLLFLPCYFSFLLSGKICSEYSIASTSGLLDAEKKEWDGDIAAAAGIPLKVLGERPLEAGAVLGTLTESVKSRVGYDCAVVLAAGHDTGSAFYAAAGEVENAVYLSSGTWSLLGACLDRPVLSKAAMESGFTNEGGVGCVRFLRNIMGMWLLQRLRKEGGDRMSFAEMAELAEEGEGYRPTVDTADPRFLNPASMREEILSALSDKGEALPKNEAELLFCVNHSLAACYARAIRDLEKLLARRFDSIVIMGGGGKNRLLNRLTEEETGKKVVLGPTEGSALGNLKIQLR